jgi:hypothetical protein
MNKSQIKKHGKKLDILAIFFLLSLPIAIIYHDLTSNIRITPPTQNCTLKELAEKLPSPRKIVIGIHLESGKKRLIWTGPIPPYTIRSGPPVYIFDEHAQLVEYCFETGEGWKYEPIKIEREITLNEALRWNEESAQ